AGEDAERGGLPRAVQAEETDDLALGDRERDRPERTLRPVVFADIAYLDDRAGIRHGRSAGEDTSGQEEEDGAALPERSRLGPGLGGSPVRAHAPPRLTPWRDRADTPRARSGRRAPPSRRGCRRRPCRADRAARRARPAAARPLRAPRGPLD